MVGWGTVCGCECLAVMNWLRELMGSGVVVTDGAWGTELQARGLAGGECPDGWNLTHRDGVLEVARAYVEAGSRVILTNTFGGNRLRLADAGIGDRVEAINRAGAEISLEAAAGRARVFGSVGPTGKLLMTGDVTVGEWTQCFEEQTGFLAAAGVDGLVVETMSDPEEARAAVAAAKQTGLPVVACMVFDTGKAKDRTMMGNTPEQVAMVLTEAGADVVGSNCGQGITGFVDICRRLKSATDRPIWIKPNAGLPEMVEGRAVYRTSPAEFAQQSLALREAGAGFLGGCCGTTPDFIRELARALA
jgi:5-methyltetrahydrofolate--homocysteine methyltransferase